MRSFWPAGESAQADYEALRHTALAGGETLSMAAARFERRGLAGLIAWPGAESVFTATVVGVTRPPWTPHADPRLDALAAGFELLLAAPADLSVITKEAHRLEWPSTPGCRPRPKRPGWECQPEMAPP